MIALITAVNECASIAIERLSRAGTEKPEVSLLIGGRGSAQDIVHHDEALARFDLKNNAPGTNQAPKHPPIFALQGCRVARNGSRLISLSAMLTRCRSLGGNPRTALPAALLSAKSQFTLEVFEADILSASTFPATALDRVNLVGLSLVDRDYTF